MANRQEYGKQMIVREPLPELESTEHVQRAAIQLEAALQTLDLETEADQAEAVIAALRATDRAYELGEDTSQPSR